MQFSSGSPATLDGVTVTAINASDGPRELLPAGTLPTVALTAPGGSHIDVITREGWGCDESLVVARLGKDRDALWPEMYVPAKKVVLHHTATSNGYTDGAAEVRSGYQPSDEKYDDLLAQSQRWEPIGNWSNPYTFTAPGHYTMHVWANTGAYEANLSFLVKGSGEGGDPPTVTAHVGDLDSTTTIKGKSGRWEARVTVTVHDANHSPVANATVAGKWSGATSGSVSGVTGGDGTVTLSTGSLSGGTSVTFEVTSVAGEGLSYDAGANHDPDGDSSGTSITVGK